MGHQKVMDRYLHSVLGSINLYGVTKRTVNWNSEDLTFSPSLAITDLKKITLLFVGCSFLTCKMIRGRQARKLSDFFQLRNL